MPNSPEILQAIKTIENQLAVIKQLVGAETPEGEVGMFDGEFMHLADGRKIAVPPNYASKSMLVPGDSLRMVADPAGGDQHRFKQIAKVERAKATGLLTRKDGKFEVICEEGSFKVFAAAIKHFEAEVGDAVTIQFAKNHTKGSWAAVEKVVKSHPSQSTSAPESPVVQSTPAPTTISHAATISHQSVEPEAAKQSEVQQPAAQGDEVITPPIVPAKPSVAPKADSTTPKQSQSNNRPAAKKTSPARPSGPRATAKPLPAKPIAKSSPAPVAAAQPAPIPSLPVQQGEINVPIVMDEDDLT
jgi:hypothetical protein